MLQSLAVQRLIVPKARPMPPVVAVIWAAREDAAVGDVIGLPPEEGTDWKKPTSDSDRKKVRRSKEKHGSLGQSRPEALQSVSLLCHNRKKSRHFRCEPEEVGKKSISKN